MIKKSIKFIIIIGMMFLLTGCTSKPLEVNELRENEEVVSYFAQRNLSITDIKLEKRQTNKEDKEDIAYVYIKAEREEAVLEGVYVIKSSYFDEGGWNVMSISCDEGGTYEPTNIVKYDITRNYQDATSIEYTNHEIIQYDKEQKDFRCNLFFTVNYEGEFATILENYSVELMFDVHEGIWRKYGEIIFIDGDYDIFVEDGTYKQKGDDSTHPNYYELTFTGVDAQLTFYEWQDYLGSEKGYKEYYLGISNYRIDNGGIVLEEFGGIYSWKPCFKICPEGIYFDYISWASDELDYDSELEKIE